MRVIVLIKANADSEAGVMPSEELLREMGKFNEELVNAGIMLDGEGLYPSTHAKRVKFTGGNRIVTDGPFAETRELIAGFWVWRYTLLPLAYHFQLPCQEHATTGVALDFATGRLR